MAKIRQFGLWRVVYDGGWVEGGFIGMGRVVAAGFLLESWGHRNYNACLQGCQGKITGAEWGPGANFPGRGAIYGDFVIINGVFVITEGRFVITNGSFVILNAWFVIPKAWFVITKVVFVITEA